MPILFIFLQFSSGIVSLRTLNLSAHSPPSFVVGQESQSFSACLPAEMKQRLVTEFVKYFMFRPSGTVKRLTYWPKCQVLRYTS
jgi:hypothetical protein